MHLAKHYTDQLNRLGRNREPFLFIIDFDEVSPLVYPLSVLPGTIRFTMPGDLFSAGKIGTDKEFFLKKKPVPYSDYLIAFEKVMEHLRHGDSYLVNLTFPTPIVTDLSLSDIYKFSKAPYKLLVDEQFVVFSPEPFIRINNGIINSYPMKGTIDAALPDAEHTLLADPKESAEHVTIVDLIRNDLSKVATHVEVSRYRYVERIRTHEKEILQVSSEIRGRLPDDFASGIGDLLNELLPAGSISGAPKKRTLEIIREAESESRGYYCGIFGVFDGRNLDSAVMIRFIEQTGEGLRYRSGGGITHLSKAEAEYEEMKDKVYLQFRSDE